jgi:hypothetical protein
VVSWALGEPGGPYDRPVEVAGLDDLVGGHLVGEGLADDPSHEGRQDVGPGSNQPVSARGDEREP